MNNGDKLAYPCDGEFAGDARTDKDAGYTKFEELSKTFMQACRVDRDSHYRSHRSMASGPVIWLKHF